MQAPLVTQSLQCTQCGGDLHPGEGQIFLTCPFCSSTVYLDKSQVVFHWYLEPTLDEPKAHAALKRWMAGNHTVKDLDEKARITSVSFEYFPLWYFKRRTSDSREEIILKPAAATAVSEITHLRLPAGDLRKYDSNLDEQAHVPNVPLSTAQKWAGGLGVSQGEFVEKALVHVPLFTFKYIYQGRPYSALVEAGTGGVFANIFPAKAEVPYRTMGCLTAAIFLSLAVIPVFGLLLADFEGALGGLVLCSVLGVVIAPILFIAAAWVSAKV
jgi:hypothetical protein